MEKNFQGDVAVWAGGRWDSKAVDEALEGKPEESHGEPLNENYPAPRREEVFYSQAQSKVHEHVERDAAVRQTKNVTDWSAPPPPPAGQFAVTAAPSRRGMDVIGCGLACALRTASAATHTAVMTKSHMDGFISARASLTRKNARITPDRRLEATAENRRLDIRVQEVAPKRLRRTKRFKTCANKFRHYSPQEVCWKFFEILRYYRKTECR